MLLGAGAVGIGLGAFFGIQALSARSDAEDNCPESDGVRRCSAAADDALSTNKTDALIADISFGVGIAAAAVGAYIVLGGGSKEGGTATAVRANARERGGELSIVGTFAWSALQTGDVSGPGTAQGLRKVSSGKPVDIQPLSWGGGILQSFRAGTTIDVRGASGNLNYDAVTEETSAPIEVWVVRQNMAGAYEIQPG